MRLLDTSTLQVKEFGAEVPQYAILSHTWSTEWPEVSFEDMQSLSVRNMVGFAKINNACALALAEGYAYMWIDTCCIDKRSSAELSEAINSMYNWYKEAHICYVYLSDVDVEEDDPDALADAVSRSRWLKRGWTLQELIAPESVIFYNREWVEIGTKMSLCQALSLATGISRDVLLWGDRSGVCIATKMCWAAGRETSRVEDVSYSLMGILGVNMPILYGERNAAFTRLQQEIIKGSNDHTIFAFVMDKEWKLELLASCPNDFARFRGIHGEVRRHTQRWSQPFSLTNVGLSIELPLIRKTLTSAPDVRPGDVSAILGSSLARPVLKPSDLTYIALDLRRLENGNYRKMMSFAYFSRDEVVDAINLEAPSSIIIEEYRDRHVIRKMSTLSPLVLLEVPLRIDEFVLSWDSVGFKQTPYGCGNNSIVFASAGRPLYRGVARIRYSDHNGEGFTILVRFSRAIASCQILTGAKSDEDVPMKQPELDPSDRDRRIISGGKDLAVNVRRRPQSWTLSEHRELFVIQARLTN